MMLVSERHPVTPTKTRHPERSEGSRCYLTVIMPIMKFFTNLPIQRGIMKNFVLASSICVMFMMAISPVFATTHNVPADYATI